MKVQRIFEVLFLALIYSIFIIILLYLSLARILPKLSRDIFHPVILEQAIVYYSILWLNLLVLVMLIIAQRNKILTKENTFTLIIHDFITLINIASKNIDHSILKVSHMDYLFAYLVHLFLKGWPNFYRNISYAIQICFIVSLSIDIFYFARFYLSYKLAPFLLIDLLIKLIIFLSITYHEGMLQEISDSLVLVNSQEAMDNSYVLSEKDYTLSKYNTQFDNVKNALYFQKLLDTENAKIHFVEYSLIKPFWFQISKRLIYISLWAYIISNYNLSIMYPLISIVLRFLRRNISPSLVVLLFIIGILLIYKNRTK